MSGKKRRKSNIEAIPVANIVEDNRNVSSASALAIDDNTLGMSFRYKLEHLKPEDITETIAEVKPKSKKLSNIIRIVMMGICVCVFAGSLFSIVKTMYEYKKAEDFYNDISEFVNGDDYLTDVNYNGTLSLLKSSPQPITNLSYRNRPATTEGTPSQYNQLFEKMKARIAAFKEKNDDVYGWIKVPGTNNIDYMLLQGEDNDYYLDHVYTGNYVKAGSIFVDYRCNKDINANHNTVIYGHNMQDNTMFSELISYLKEDFFNKNKYIYIYTTGGMYTYEVFSVFKTDYRYNYIETDFESHEAFVDFAYEMKAKSLYQREGIEFNENSRIITLSTCTNGRATDRYCVQALLVNAFNKFD